jgi:hypothetical protein
LDASKRARTLVFPGKFDYDSRKRESVYVARLKHFRNRKPSRILSEGHQGLFQLNILGGIDV